MRYTLIFSLALLTGCATIVTGTSTEVSLSSSPTNAEVKINGQDYGETPTVVSLDSDRSHVVRFNLEGYEEETVQLKKSSSGWVAGNLLFGGIPGFIIDAASGGMYVLSPKQATANMEKMSTSSATNLEIRVGMNVSGENLTKIGQMKAK